MQNTQALWQPTDEQISQSLISHFMEEHGFSDYESLYQWSIEYSVDFWSALWSFCGIIGNKGERVLIDADNIEKARWFPDARLNYAQNLLRKRGPEDAIVFRAENKLEYRLSHDELHDQVCAIAHFLRQSGVVKGDCVAGYLPNMPEAVVALLATASIGAIWTSTSPDFGADSVIERFGQTAPKVLFTANGYYYNNKTINLSDKIAQIAAAIPSLEKIVLVPLLESGAILKLTLPHDIWPDLIFATHPNSIDFELCAFDHPLYVLYSSGTTGKPKCITHKAGGALIQHLKEHQLHNDIQPGDKVFYFTTCGWMMWNWLISALASGATLMLYDGSPFRLKGRILWDYVEAEKITLFGTSAKYIDALKKARLSPSKSHDLNALRTLCSTGSVLAPESFDYVYQHIKQDMCLSSISGGTDIVSCFILGCPILPVYRGECQCRGLGMAVEVYDDQGLALQGEKKYNKGELVCTKTFPCQPAFFWGDDNGEKYHQAYFAKYPNIWHHGDYISLTEHDGVLVHGRSDATLNPGGVRIGTAEIYRHVEQLDEVLESIVIGQDWKSDVRVVLFVILQDGLQLDKALISLIRQTIREKCTPRHMPAKVIQVTAIPRTKSGKIVELAVRQIVHGHAVKNLNALSNPEALQLYENLAELQI